MPQRIGDHVTPRLERTLIRRFEYFKTMSDPELECVIRSARVLRIRRGQPVFRQGDLAQDFYFLLQGRLKAVQVAGDGQQILVRIVHPGEFFGIAKALCRSDYPASAIAVVESRALAWNSALWETMTERYPALTMSALHTVGRQLQDMHARIRELSTEDVERRVAHALSRLVKRAGRQTKSGILIDFPITRQDVAEMAGTTVPTVSRILTAWAEKGLVEGGRLRIVIREPHRLLELAQK